MMLRLLAWLLPGLVAAGTALLIGCAQWPGGSADSGATPADRPDLVTASDETPARRRARIRLELAAGYFESDKATIALDEVKQAIAADPTFGDAFNLRGLIYMRLNDFALADDSFRRAVALNPRDANAMHNHGWLLCEQKRFAEADRMFAQAAAQPGYADKAKTLMTMGLCEVRAGQPAEAERILSKSYEIDPGNPITGFTLANLLYQRREYQRAQFYIRRVNNSDYATAESLWLGVRVERRLEDRVASQQLADQLRKRFPLSVERAALDRGAFDE
ncbi:type IV pilus biogenesis/stability protein PilW [uncultured Xylophilus sp.]|uniref:type IV pilus biogenesis/stability protein PilW n=1 Tax=uncultured Xylophilus sp. TaxID=296832 RepID=UPI0025ED6F87|nr:type IV pilus biogenesis/stability protein PilW [uncultured Xylophilus sp.]